ncbi:hypothetical protein AB0I10_10995 [Streptomyces sp. NPDC050636]|uniref:hypothetical protein n=1 Tax=Streptomyces sp. NPDC050636 TaxID=3154510 RepID=UPI00343B34DB
MKRRLVALCLRLPWHGRSVVELTSHVLLPISRPGIRFVVIAPVNVPPEGISPG